MQASIGPEMDARRLALVLIVLLATPAGAVTVDELPIDRTLRVRTIRVEGAEEVGASTIKDAMVTSLPPWYKVWSRWRARVELNRELFQNDLRRIEQVLREAGYYDAAVTHDLRLDEEEGTVEVVVTVAEGKPVLVEEVALAAADFTLTPEEKEEIRAELALVPEQPFTQEAYEAAATTLAERWANEGFAYVKVERSAVVDTAAHAARVRYAIRRGPPAVFGETTIAGLTAVKPALVDRERAYAPGGDYDPRKLAKTQARVFGLRLFRAVNVAPGDLEEEDGVVDVRVDVTEGPPREIRAGVGYGNEDGARGELRWQHYNFLGGGRQLGFRLKGSEIEQTFGAEFRQPYFLAKEQTLIVPLIQSRLDEPGFDDLSISLTPRIERILTPTLRMAVGLTAEYHDLSDVPDATVARLEEFEPRGLVFGPIVWLERNTADDLVDPTDGSIVRLTMEQAGGPWQGDYTFARGVLDARRYLPLGGRRVLAGRVRLGAGDGFGASDDVPMFRRFFAGGIDSTRGYGRHLVGPLNEFEAPVGGRTLAEANLELRLPIWGPIGGVVFFDAGEVRRQPLAFAVDDLQYGTGLGVRYQTPVGPLRLDLGFPLDPPPGEPSWRIHFSIGQAF